MQSVASRYPCVTYVAAMIVVGAMVLAGCGPEEDPDPCADASCEFGVCNPESGECDNRDSCEFDDDCIAGYACHEGSCTAVTGCDADEDCATGNCEEGACVNPETCTSDEECVERTYCRIEEEAEEGTCEPDPCTETTCERGVCDRGTNECVSAESCTVASQSVDCVAGEKCAVPEGSETGTCKGAETYCEEVTCDRGVCTFEAEGCTDAAECEADEECLEGKFCNEMGQCQPDFCVQDDIECEGDGVCIPSSGECENADPCSSNDDCVDSPNHWCIDGTCRLASAACGDAGGEGGCPGNQECEYDGEETAASCVEPETCETSFDCTGDRQCGGRGCVDAQSCSADEFEPNDEPGEVTNFAEAADEQTLSASLCPGDTDQYELLVDEIVDGEPSGTLVVEADVRQRELGLGALNLRVVGVDGNEIGEVSTGAMGEQSHLRITTDLGESNPGEFTIEVTGGGDVKPSGVDYDLSAEVVGTNSVSACEDSETIQVNQRVSGTTANSEATGLGSSCTERRNGSAEKVYALQVEEPQEVTFELTPQSSDANLTMSLRSRCTQFASEKGCANAAGPGDSEQMTALLAPGTHYLIVQAPAGEEDAGGAFELNTERVPTACTPRGSYCEQGGTAQVCTDDGGRFEQVDCDLGCDPSTGRCNRDEGNVCETAATITPDSTENRQVDLNQVSDEYGLEDGSCLGETPRTGGPDQTFEVTVPARTAFTADVAFGNSVEGSVYLVEDCSDTDESCKAGAQGTVRGEFRERLTYANTTQAGEEDDPAETLYLVVDTASDQTVTTAELQVSYEDVVCEPNASRCDQNDGTSVEECGPYGRQWETIRDCPLGCNSNTGACMGNTCSSPVEVPDSGGEQTYQFNPDGTFFSDDHDLSFEDCGPEAMPIYSGPEGVFAVEADAGERIEASWDHDDPVLYIASECGNFEGTCGHGASSEEDETVSATYVAPSDGTYFVVADVQHTARDCGFGSGCDEPGTQYDQGTVTIEVESAACNPHDDPVQCSSGGSALDYCSRVGEWVPQACVGCNNGSCSGDTCSDAVNIPADGTEHTYEVNPETYTNELDIDGSTCMENDYDDSNGPEAIFSVDAQVDDVIRASWHHDDPSFYLTDECSQSSLPGSCLAGEEATGDEEVEVEHVVDEAGTYYLVPDIDGTSPDFRDGTFTAQVRERDCTQGSYAPRCDGDQLRWCTPLNITELYDCQDGCSNDACGSPQGEICADARPMEDGDSVSGEAFEGTNRLDPQADAGDDETIGNCVFDDEDLGADEETAGAERIHEVELASDEVLHADYDGDYYGDVMYLLSDCSDTSSCLDVVDTDGSITYASGDSQETVYVVVDNQEVTDGSESFDLDIEVSEECSADSFTPTCDGSGNLEYCADGRQQLYDCQDGCSSGACGTPTGGICADAVEVQDGDTVSNKFDGTNSIDPEADADEQGEIGSCDFGDDGVDQGTAGAETVYEVSLGAAETLTADYDGQSSPDGSDSGSDVMYLLRDCNDTSTCVRAVASDEQFSYTASDGAEDVYVVVDHGSYTDEPSGEDGYGFTLDISIASP